ncbi:MAG: aminotransferase class I/II-fold pyridoxal phosphate-dependent enzyme, partial [Candidatus Puniceispirillum sp.]
GKLADWRQQNRQRIAARVTVFQQALAQLDGWDLRSCGAYFGFVRHPFVGADSVEVAQSMARKAGVLVIPGAFFGNGQEAMLRFAFANAGRDVIGHLAARLQLLA